ncbi:MAG: ABC transporter permease [Acidobacteria bacterium]|nr:ABC transporter permease [Acidobacteriota bacterium]
MMRARTKLVLLVGLLAALHAVVLLAGFFAPYDVEAQNRELAFAPPTRVRFVDQQGHFHLRPFLYPWVERPGTIGEFQEDRSRRYPVRFFVTGQPYKVGGFLTGRVHLFVVDAPARIFLLGSDAFGRDLYSRMLYGGQISLLAGLLATALSLGCGLILGSVAGFYGGWADDLLMRVAELFLALPWLYLLFALRAFLPLHISPTRAFLLVVVVIGTVGWARPARLVRGVVLTAKERDYVRAAIGFGASDAYLLRRHVLPQTFGVLLTQAALLVPQYILAEVTLSFLGLGVSEPVPSWGNMLSTLQQYHVLASYWWMFLPGLVLVPFFLGYAALATVLHERLKAAYL